MTMTELENGINNLWSVKLINDWYKIHQEICYKMNKAKVLNVPNFRISKLNNRWGQWNRDNRSIDISLKLLRNFEWNAVVDTLKHEMAHQFVDEYLQLNHVAHGDIFEYACKIFNIKPRTGCGADEKAAIVGEDAIFSKVRKLLAKGSDSAVTEAEGQAFLEKAHEIMLKYNIEISNIVNSGKFFVKRPVTPIYRRWESYLFSIGSLMNEFYNIKYIQYGTVGGYYLEYFGEPTNLDVAEYITHVLINQGEILYKEFLKKHKENRKNGLVFRKASKAAFMNGLISGYREKLREQKKKVMSKEVISDENGRTGEEILLVGSKILEEHFRKSYNIRHIQVGGLYGSGYNEGKSVGGNISINPGVGTGNGVKLLA